MPSEKVPKIGTSGEKYRDKQLTYQLPRQDLTLNYCKHVENDNRASYEDFVAARNEIALDVGFIRDSAESGKCHQCNESINQGEMCVNAPKLSDEVKVKILFQIKHNSILNYQCFSSTFILDVSNVQLVMNF